MIPSTHYQLLTTHTNLQYKRHEWENQKLPPLVRRSGIVAFLVSKLPRISGIFNAKAYHSYQRYKDFRTACQHVFIILFCLFHIAAIAIYSLPDVDPGSVGAQVKKPFLPFIQPYLFATSQWQQWNLFAPDPTQRVTHYTVEAQIGTAWKNIADIAPERLPWWRMADELKLIGTFESNTNRALRVPYLRQYCGQLHLRAGTPLRMLSHFAIISREHPMSPQDWLTTLYVEAQCP